MELNRLKKIDIGSGDFKKPGFVGIDIVQSGDVDIVCDIERSRWPLEDESVCEVFSSHCFEHIEVNNLIHIFSEMTRVCVDGAKVEIWHPYLMHRDAYLLGHIARLSEEMYYHFCLLHRTWAPALGARWLLKEVRYHVDPGVIASCEKLGICADFAVNHLFNVVKEVGIFIEIDKTHSLDPGAFERTIVDDVATVPLRESRNRNRRVLSVGAYVPGGSTPQRRGLLSRLLGRR
jgi:hypothetical protein